MVSPSATVRLPLSSCVGRAFGYAFARLLAGDGALIRLGLEGRDDDLLVASIEKSMLPGRKSQAVDARAILVLEMRIEDLAVRRLVRPGEWRTVTAEIRPAARDAALDHERQFKSDLDRHPATAHRKAPARGPTWMSASSNAARQVLPAPRIAR